MNRAGWIVAVAVVLMSVVLASFAPQSVAFLFLAVVVVVGITRIPSRG